MRIEARELSAGYGRRPVLECVDVDLNSGELVGLIGPNGAGKSTLLRALSGVLAPSCGAVSVDGRNIAALSARERARSIAFVPQTEAALFDFTVREIVLMGRYAHHAGLRGDRKDDFEEAARAMSAADTLHLADRPITSLSGGEHRRVLLARALAQRAPCMLLDEPTAHLDVTHQAEVLALLHRLARQENVAVLAALHDLNLASDYCDRLVLLAGGAVLSSGRPEDVMTPELLSRAYGADLQVARNPASGRPFLVSRPPDAGAHEQRIRVHIICGGGSGLETLSALHRRGYPITAGVLNRLDSDEQAASVLGIPVATEAPFSRIGEKARAECEAMIRDADAIVVTPMPLGNGNLPNLEMALQAKLGGKTVYLMGGVPIDRDFAGGAGAALWTRLLEKGAVPTADLPALEAELGRIPVAEDIDG